jgi:hypothetical protein
MQQPLVTFDDGLNGSLQHHLIWNLGSKVVCMTQGQRVALSAAQRTELWSRWKAGESLHRIGRAFGKPHNSIHGFLSQYGGIVPPVRRRSRSMQLSAKTFLAGSILVPRFAI